MLIYISIVIVLVIDLIAVELKKSYQYLPTREVKYRATHGDEVAKQLYKAAAYGQALEIFLWAVIALATTGSIFLFASFTPFWLSFIVAILLLWLVFAWIPQTKVAWLTNLVVRYFSPTVAWIMHYLYPVMKILRISSTDKSAYHKRPHIYDSQDLVDLIKNLKNESSSRIDPKLLGFLRHSLNLASTKVRDTAKPWSKVKVVTSEETIGPVLLDELHKSQQQFIPVKNKSEPKKLIGILDMSRLDINQQGKVSNYMDKVGYYLNEEDTLDDAFQAFGKTNYPAFIIVDDHQRFIGLLTLADIIDKLISATPDVASPDYGDIEAVSQKYAHSEVEPDQTDTSSPD